MDALFAPEENEASGSRAASQPWKVLVVDDDAGVHEVTKLALGNFEFDGRPLELLHAYSAYQAIEIIRQHADIAVAMIDVVMEREHAGLELVREIREGLKNKLIRLILRTGQPGQAPERVVIRDYDINDYKEKSELSAQKLYSSIFTSLRSYRDLAALDANRRGLEHVIRASGAIFQISELSQFIQGVLEQLIALLYLDTDSIFVNCDRCDSLALENRGEHLRVLAATGRYADLVGMEGESSLPEGVAAAIHEALASKAAVVRDGVYVGYFQPDSGREDVIYITSTRKLNEDDLNLVQLFLHNVSIAYENALLRDEIEGTQRDMVYMLGESIETRSRETGQHVRRVAEYCRLIALGVGLSEREAEILHIASPLHDFGKIGIPDAILHKPGKLEPEEWSVMQTHATVGRDMLARSKREILQAAALLAGQHHERWDGTGYPNGLAGETIHIYGRIGAVADVFDALASRRSYKEPWPAEKILDFLQAQRGMHFDPAIVDWVLANSEQMLGVLTAYPDQPHEAH
jgi:response regulator RpfG family c-di-GMP phosphodiesterase